MPCLYPIFTEFPKFMISRSRVFFMYLVFPCQGYRPVTPLDAARIFRKLVVRYGGLPPRWEDLNRERVKCQEMGKTTHLRIGGGRYKDNMEDKTNWESINSDWMEILYKKLSDHKCPLCPFEIIPGTRYTFAYLHRGTLVSLS